MNLDWFQFILKENVNNSSNWDTEAGHRNLHDINFEVLNLTFLFKIRTASLNTSAPTSKKCHEICIYVTYSMKKEGCWPQIHSKVKAFLFVLAKRTLLLEKKCLTSQFVCLFPLSGLTFILFLSTKFQNMYAWFTQQTLL